MKVNSNNLVEYIMAFEGDENFSKEKLLDLFSYLIKTGQAWSLQGFYGRTASDLIEAGYISETGKILKNFEEGE